ncbi:MAG: hypothetical protein IH840_06800 [Candidatus Heimdallarchaeota archaeon]|nr:hypothetical protein [Candidatus Heimdallarchaeota archaeon]
MNGSIDWAAFVPSPQWQKVHDTPRTLLDHLPMIGPLSSFITQGTKMELPVLGLLGYCSLQEDPSAALVAVAEIEKLRGMQIAIKDNLVRFDYSFIPSTFFPMKKNQNGSLGSFDQSDIEEDDGDDEEFGFSMDELT